MVKVEVSLRDGFIDRLDIDGHAKDTSICVGLSLLARTYGRVLDMSPALTITERSDGRGSYHIRVFTYPRTSLSWLHGMSTMLIEALKDLLTLAKGDLEVTLVDEFVHYRLEGLKDA